MAYELVQGEAVALNLKTGLYYKLNHVAACAFDYLARGLALRDLEDFLLREFEVDRATLRGDLVGLLADLEKYGLVIRGPRMRRTEQCSERNLCKRPGESAREQSREWQ